VVNQKVRTKEAASVRNAIVGKADTGSGEVVGEEERKSSCGTAMKNTLSVRLVEGGGGMSGRSVYLPGLGCRRTCWAVFPVGDIPP
jgi:hypothetical protein